MTKAISQQTVDKYYRYHPDIDPIEKRSTVRFRMPFSGEEQVGYIKSTTPRQRWVDYAISYHDGIRWRVVMVSRRRIDEVLSGKQSP